MADNFSNKLKVNLAGKNMIESVPISNLHSNYQPSRGMILYDTYINNYDNFLSYTPPPLHQESVYGSRGLLFFAHSHYLLRIYFTLTTHHSHKTLGGRVEPESRLSKKPVPESCPHSPNHKLTMRRKATKC